MNKFNVSLAVLLFLRMGPTGSAEVSVRGVGGSIVTGELDIWISNVTELSREPPDDWAVINMWLYETMINLYPSRDRKLALKFIHKPQISCHFRPNFFHVSGPIKIFIKNYNSHTNSRRAVTQRLYHIG